MRLVHSGQINNDDRELGVCIFDVQHQMKYLEMSFQRNGLEI